MLLRPRLRHVLVTAASLTVICTPVGAQAGESGWRNGSWYGSEAPPQSPADHRGPPPPIQRQGDEPLRQEPHAQASRFTYPGRDAWLADCRSRVSARDNGVGGAVIGGVVGGVAGNRIAGRHNRVVGTVAGAAVGAVAGSAIDRAKDRARDHDECEAYLDDYYARYAAGAYGAPFGYAGYAPAYGQTGYSYGGARDCCGQVQMAPECTETVEYIYEDVPVGRPAHRPASRRTKTKIVPDKRLKIVPDKRVVKK